MHSLTQESWNSGGRPNKERRWYDTGRVGFESWHREQFSTGDATNVRQRKRPVQQFKLATVGL